MKATTSKEPERIRIGRLNVWIERGDIDTPHLSIDLQTGRFKVTVPLDMVGDKIWRHVISNWDWIEKQRRKFRARQRKLHPPHPFYADKASIRIWGRSYPLRIVEVAGPPSVKLTKRYFTLRIHPGTSVIVRDQAIEQWLRDQVQAAVPPLLAKWEERLGVRATQIKVYRAKSKWGSCAYGCGRIMLSSRLAERPIECLDYVVLHELAHLIQSDHSERFWALLDQHLPEWPSLSATLNACYR